MKILMILIVLVDIFMNVWLYRWQQNRINLLQEQNELLKALIIGRISDK